MEHTRQEETSQETINNEEGHFQRGNVPNNQDTEKEAKINDKGFIPVPKIVRWKEELVYYREIKEKDIFRKYNGVGLSVSSISQMDKDKKYLIKLMQDSYETYYLTSVEMFRTSVLFYDNNGDEQKIVSFHSMDIIHSTRPEKEIKIKRTKYTIKQARLEW